MKDKFINVIFSTIDELNDLRADGDTIPQEMITPLYGEDGFLDSLDLVNFITILEEKLEDDLNLELTLVNSDVLSQENSPFATIDSLVNYITSLVNK
jgi:acyl carrier protein